MCSTFKLEKGFQWSYAPQVFCGVDCFIVFCADFQMGVSVVVELQDQRQPAFQTHYCSPHLC